MRAPAVLLFAIVLCSAAAWASVCDSGGRPDAMHAGWRIDHYFYDASLDRDWKVLVDCGHPGVPARIELTQLRAEAKDEVRKMAADEGRPTHRGKAVRFPIAVPVKAGDTVEVVSSAHAPARIALSGIAMQSAFAGQVIRVRLSASGRFVSGIVRGPHSIEMAAAGTPSWRKP